MAGALGQAELYLRSDVEASRSRGDVHVDSRSAADERSGASDSDSMGAWLEASDLTSSASGDLVKERS